MLLYVDPFNLHVYIRGALIIKPISPYCIHYYTISNNISFDSANFFLRGKNRTSFFFRLINVAIEHRRLASWRLNDVTSNNRNSYGGLNGHNSTLYSVYTYNVPLLNKLHPYITVNWRVIVYQLIYSYKCHRNDLHT